MYYYLAQFLFERAVGVKKVELKLNVDKWNINKKNTKCLFANLICQKKFPKSKHQVKLKYGNIKEETTDSVKLFVMKCFSNSVLNLLSVKSLLLKLFSKRIECTLMFNLNLTELINDRGLIFFYLFVSMLNRPTSSVNFYENDFCYFKISV